MPMNRKRWLLPLAVVIGIGAITPSYIRAYRVAGSSDAPSFLVGDRIFVIKAAYDLRLPYTDVIISSHSHPERGDVVMFWSPELEAPVFKRVVGRPGDTVAMRDNRLEVNGVAMTYERVDATEFQAIADKNRLGTTIEREIGNGPPHLVTHSPGGCADASFEPVRVPEDHYFVLGDNRDNSRDSRMDGTVPRRAILGKVSDAFRSVP